MLNLDNKKKNNIFLTGWVKFLIGWIVVFGIRLIPFRVPNVEPLTATQMPFAKKFGGIGGFVFGFVSILIFDLATSGVGYKISVSPDTLSSQRQGLWRFYCEIKSNIILIL